MTMKTFTSASANKYLRMLEEDKHHILSTESDTCTYVLAKDEESEPPIYDYEDVRARVDAIDEQVCKVRHALHSFNLHTTLPDSDMTVDEALIVMAQLNNKRRRLDALRNIMPVQREKGRYTGNLIEYKYANFDVAKAQEDFVKVTEAINELQLQIDLCNQTITFEVEV